MDDLIDNYVQNWSCQEERGKIMEKVEEMAGGVLLAANDKEVVDKITRGEKVERQ